MASRRFSQAISEGDGISIIVEIHDLEAARAAASAGAEALVIREAVAGLRDACDLPLLWRGSGPLHEAQAAGADACLIVVEDHGQDGEGLEALHAEAGRLGLDCVVEVRDEDELELALERIDPEIFLLAAASDANGGPLEPTLDLLPDVPAGKLAVADVRVSGREQVVELERAGVDAVVIVGRTDVAELVGDAPPPV